MTVPTLKEARDKVVELSQKGLDTATATDMTTSEQKAALDKLDVELEQWMGEVKSLEQVEERRKAYQAAVGGTSDPGSDSDGDTAPTRKSLGQQFVESAGYKGLVQRGVRGGKWTTGDIDLKDAFTEGTVAAPGPGNAWVATPTVLPGVVDIRFPELVVADLIPSGATSSPLIRYLVETALTNAAATVPEGGTKPESAIKFDKVDETLHKIATFLPVSDEILEDWAQAQSYIDARLMLFVKIEEEQQLLTGDGQGTNMVGLLNRPGLATPVIKGTAPSVADDNSMDAIYRQITKIRTTAFLEPDAIVVESNAWESIILAKNSMGVYYAAGPFVGQQPATLWGKRVVVTPRMSAGTSLVGAFGQASQMFSKGGLTVEASNSHADYFRTNFTAIRAEERKGLAVYRPGAFGVVENL